MELPELGKLAIVATACAVVFWSIFYRKFNRQTTEAEVRLLGVLRETISDLKVRVGDLEKERDIYREQKHMLAGELQAANLKIEEMKGLPDMRAIVELIVKNASQQDKAFADLFESIKKLNDKIDRK